jgi:hypothetical protein
MSLWVSYLDDLDFGYSIRVSEDGKTVMAALLKEWYDDDYDGAELLSRSGEALAEWSKSNESDLVKSSQIKSNSPVDKVTKWP